MSSSSSSSSSSSLSPPLFCCLKPGMDNDYDAAPSLESSHRRARLLRVHQAKWLNGTVLHYYFFDKEDGQLSKGLESHVGSAGEEAVVERAFQTWANVGLGIQFERVYRKEDAEIRIGFRKGDGAWSYLGRRRPAEVTVEDPTMNFGWDLTTRWNGLDTALHEIGHALGFPHEHQNPLAGIVWNDEAVYEYLGGPPNHWPRSQTHYNILRKLPLDQVEGSEWDANSIMHYPFAAGLIAQPTRYATEPLQPAGGLSAADKAKVRQFYPPLVVVHNQDDDGDDEGGGEYGGDGDGGEEDGGDGDGGEEDEGDGNGGEDGGNADGDNVPPSPEEEEEEELVPLLASVSVKLTLEPGQQRNFLVVPTQTETHYIQTFGSSDTYMALYSRQDNLLRAEDDDSGYERNARLQVELNTGQEYILRLRLMYNGHEDEEETDATPPPAGSVMMWTGWGFSSTE